MAKKIKKKQYCTPNVSGRGHYKVESLISIDERGQTVLPKEVREKAGINPGDKLVVVSLEKGEGICCISLIKVEQFAEMVKNFLGPLMQEVLKK